MFDLEINLSDFPLVPRERLMPSEILIADALASHGTAKELPEIMGLSRETIKTKLFDIRRKTRCNSTRQLAIYWQCPLFQEGLKVLGIR